MDKSNIIDLISQRTSIPDSLYQQMQILDLKPEWFIYYFNDSRGYRSTDPLFWKQLLTASIRNENLNLTLKILQIEKQYINSITAEGIINYAKRQSSYMTNCIIQNLK